LSPSLSPTHQGAAILSINFVLALLTPGLVSSIINFRRTRIQDHNPVSPPKKTPKSKNQFDIWKQKTKNTSGNQFSLKSSTHYLIAL
jgi:hypothetical protein